MSPADLLLAMNDSDRSEAISLAKDFFSLMVPTLVFLLTIVVDLALMLILVAILPNLTGRAVLKARTRGLMSVLVGALPVILLVLLCVGAFKKAPPVAIVLAALMCPLILLGLASTSEALGRRVFLLAGRERSRPLHLLVGWPLLAVACCIPIVGWFVVFPYALLLGIGSVILGLASRENL